MPRREAAARVQVYLNDPRVLAAVNREAKVSKSTISQAAGRILARGLQRSPQADPEDRLTHLERALRDHMRTSNRDLQIIQEVLIELAKAFFLRLPDSVADQDPTVQASVERRIDRLLDAVAARIVQGRDRPDPAEADPQESGRPPLRSVG